MAFGSAASGGPPCISFSVHPESTTNKAAMALVSIQYLREGVTVSAVLPGSAANRQPHKEMGPLTKSERPLRRSAMVKEGIRDSNLY